MSAGDRLGDARVLALAGLVQALQQVRRIADTGQGDGAVLETALDSVFRIDAESPSGVYGGVSALRPGLVLLQRYFRNDSPWPCCNWSAASVAMPWPRESTTASSAWRRRPRTSGPRILKSSRRWAISTRRR